MSLAACSMSSWHWARSGFPSIRIWHPSSYVRSVLTTMTNRSKRNIDQHSYSKSPILKISSFSLLMLSIFHYTVRWGYTGYKVRQIGWAVFISCGFVYTGTGIWFHLHRKSLQVFRKWFPHSCFWIDHELLLNRPRPAPSPGSSLFFLWEYLTNCRNFQGRITWEFDESWR